MLELTGLRQDNPQGWLAATGVLSLLHEMGISCQRSWQSGVAVLHGVGRDALIEYLQSALLDRQHLSHNNWLDSPSSINQQQFDETVLTGTSLDWLSVYLPLGVGGGKGVLDLTGGTLLFSKVIRQTICEVQKHSESSLREALYGPWTNSDNVASLGWDPAALKMSATFPGNDAPSSAAHQVTSAAQWLAAESLPITGLSPKSRSYRWVSWSVPLDLESIRSIVLSESTQWGGVKYESRVSRNGKVGYLELPLTVSNHENRGRLAGVKYS